MRSKFVMAWVVLAGCTLVSLDASAQLYQWRDSNGRSVYSDSPPPPGTPAGNILKSPKPREAAASAPAEVPKAAGDAKAPAAPAQKSIADREAEYKKRQADTAEKAQKDEQAANAEKQRAERCTLMRRQLATLESGQRVSRQNDKGERVFLEDADRAQEAQRYKKDMADAKCN